MNNIRFSCPKCGQHLACEPVMLGQPIGCPACKKPIRIVNEQILDAYRFLELGPVALLDEIRQAHRERIKMWDPDLFPNDPRSQEVAAAKTKQLNQALEVLTGYFSGRYTEAQPAPKAAPEEVKAPKAPPRAPAEKSGAPPKTQPAIGLDPRTRTWLMWILIGIGVTVVVGGLVGAVFLLLQRTGPPITDESTIVQWTKAKEWTKRTYCRAVVVKMSREGVLRKYRVRLNEDDFYDGLEAIARQPKPEDADRKLLDLCTGMVQAASTIKLPAGE